MKGRHEEKTKSVLTNETSNENILYIFPKQIIKEITKKTKYLCGFNQYIEEYSDICLGKSW